MPFFFGKKKTSPPPDFKALRQRMIRRDLMGRDIDDPRVLRAMEHVPREHFLSVESHHMAYEDHAIPIGFRQTMSQPYIVALTLQMAELSPDDHVLEVGAGSGYATAVLAHLVRSFVSLEIIPELAQTAQQCLDTLGIKNGRILAGDASHGYEASGPYDAIVSAAAPQNIPDPLLEQLAPGGRLVCPVGAWKQRMYRARKGEDGQLNVEKGIGVMFVPMTGAVQETQGTL